MPEFFETRMGKTFYEGTMPRIAEALTVIAASVHRQEKTTQRQAQLEAFVAHVAGLTKPEAPDGAVLSDATASTLAGLVAWARALTAPPADRR